MSWNSSEKEGLASKGNWICQQQNVQHPSSLPKWLLYLLMVDNNVVLIVVTVHLGKEMVKKLQRKPEQSYCNGGNPRGN